MDTDQKKRRILSFLVGAVAGGGLVAGAIPFIRSMNPTAVKERPHLDIDITKLKDGQMLSVSWLGKPLYVLKRSPAILQTLDVTNPDLLDPNSLNSNQPPWAKNNYRSLNPEILLVWGICTHLGCAVSHNPPTVNPEYGKDFEKGLYFCPCHGAKYDLAGRVYQNVPAQRNLDVPNYEFVADNIIRVHGKDGQTSN